MRRSKLATAAVVGLILEVALTAASPASEAGAAPPNRPDITWTAVTFAALPGWRDDDHGAAFATFLRSCEQLLSRGEPAKEPGVATGASASALLDACRQATMRATRAAANPARAGRAKIGRTEARAFFEHFFRPHRVEHTGSPGLLTGYYEPLLDASRVRTERFSVPLYRRPPDLENVVEESQRGAPGTAFTHMRRTGAGLTPYPTRTEIEAGALAGQGLELVWVADPVDAFFLQIQGSGLVRFADGTSARITYDGKNGHPYTSVGRYLIDQGVIGADSMTLERLGDYLRADGARGRVVMQQNGSFVFFRELAATEGDRPLGAMSIGLTPGRSLAVDASVHQLGVPIYVVARTLRHLTPGRPMQRLMVAQDVGSAIRGPERGDVYFGSGPEAGARAGITKHPGRLYVLLPRAVRSVVQASDTKR